MAGNSSGADQLGDDVLEKNESKDFTVITGMLKGLSVCDKE